MFRRALLIGLALTAVAGLAATGATSKTNRKAASRMQVGIFDPAFVRVNPPRAFKLLAKTRAQVLRSSLEWGAIVAAKRRPVNPANPADRAYNWEIYDEIVKLAAQRRIKILFSIYGTPRWASGSRALNRAPRRMSELKLFAYAAAKRYSGTFIADPKDPDAKPLPRVSLWLAWNEPNNPVFLQPQFKRVGSKYVVWSARLYSQICTAIYSGIHKAGGHNEQVGCGGTAPRGNNLPRSSRPSVSPLVFLRSLKAYHLRTFDAYAHHPYATSAQQTPFTKPKSNAITMANIGLLTGDLVRRFGHKPLWITEYGYQTRPPDRVFGVSWRNQARFMAQAYGIARRNQSITMMLWFLVKDEPRLSGWQSGLFTFTGRAKPAYNTFRRLPR
jgi:hypothetical protein